MQANQQTDQRSSTSTGAKLGLLRAFSLWPVWQHMLVMVVWSLAYVFATFPNAELAWSFIVIYPVFVIGILSYAALLVFATGELLTQKTGILNAADHNWYRFCLAYTAGYTVYAWLYCTVLWQVSRHNIIILMNASLLLLGFMLLFPALQGSIKHVLNLANVLQRWQQQEGGAKAKRFNARNPLSFLAFLHVWPSIEQRG